MTDLGLRYEELQAIFQLCYWIVIDQCPPDFDFRGFVVGRLMPAAPETAARVSQMTDEQINALCREVMEHQKMTR